MAFGSTYGPYSGNQFGGGYPGSYAAVSSPLNSLCGSLCGVLVGLMMLFSTLFLIHSNEGMAVRTAESLAEGLEQVISVNAHALDSVKLEGKLVHVTGFVDGEEIEDPQLGVKERAICLARHVQMLQWVERTRENKREVYNPNTGSSEVQIFNDFYHVPSWESAHIESAGFHYSASDNGPVVNPPAMPFSSQNFRAKQARIGQLKIGESLLDLVSADTQVNIQIASKLPSKYVVEQGQIQSWSSGKSAAKIGDITVRYSVLKPQIFSLIGQVRYGEISTYFAKAGDNIHMMEAGSRTAEQMFQTAQEWNNFRTWALRAVAFVMMFVAIRLMLDPLASIFLVIPFLGSFLQSLVGIGISLASFGIAASLSLLFTSFSWFWFRPMLSITLIVCALVPLYFLKARVDSNSARSQYQSNATLRRIS